MPDWSVIQVDDIAWDDHIVPHPSGKQLDDCVVQKGDCHKKKRKSADKSVLNDDLKERLGNSYHAGKDRKVSTLYEKGSWSQTPDDAFPDSCVANSIKEMAALASNDASTSGNGFKSNDIGPLDNEFCEDNSILGNSGASMNDNLCHFSLGDVSPTANDLELFSNDHMDKENNSLQYYGWPDIGNFEDVDRMFRSCDSTFGQGNTTNDDALPWISSSLRAINDSQEDMKSGFKCSSSDLNTIKGTSQHHEGDIKLMPISATQGNSDSFGHSYGYWRDANTERNMLCVPKEHVNLQRQQLGNHNQSEGKRIFPSPEYLDFDSFHNSATPQQFANVSPSSSAHLSTERPSNQPPNAAFMTLRENIEKGSSRKMQNRLVINHEHKDFSRLSLPPVQRQLQNIKDGVGGNIEVEEVSAERLAVEGDSFSVQGGSSMNYLLSDGIQPEASSFWQLQNVMEQLDIKTKLCIRDSLYRLARSAEQRRSFENSNCCIRDGSDITGVLTSEESNKYTGFIDMETETNPIDRSIANLLFHRASDPTDGALSLESHTIMLGPVSSEAVVPENLVCRKEDSGSVDVKLSIPNTDR